MSFYKAKIDSENVKMSWNFYVDETKCENPSHYQDYIRFQALQDEADGFGVTYLYIEHNDETGAEKIMGYITLRTTSFIKDMGESKKFGYPALEISELAVDKNYAGNHIGTDMVMDAINMANAINDIASIKYVVLCSDPMAEAFYEKLEFVKMCDTLEEIPRERANIECVPMYIKLR